MPLEFEALSPDELEAAAEAFAALTAAQLDEAIRIAMREAGITDDGPEPDPSDVDRIPVIWAAIVAAVLLPVLSESMTAAQRETVRAFDAAVERSTGRRLSTLLPGINEPLSTDLYLRNAENRLVGIGDELWQNARDGIAAGVAAGETQPQIARRVRDAASVTAPRSRTIARTESHGARNWVNMQTIRRVNQDFGVADAIQKEWQATGDDRMRPDHAAATGQTVPLNEPFTVGGASLDFPGDPNGPADQIINCRCGLLTVVDDDALGLITSGDTVTITAAQTYQEGDAVMPWSIERSHPDCSEGEWAVVKDDDGALEGCHETRDGAVAQIAALNAAESDDDDASGTSVTSFRNTAPWSGVLLVEGVPTGDGRQFALGALTWPELGSTTSLEIPLGWMYERSHGGMQTDKVVTVGRIDRIERRGSELHASGVLNLDSEWGREAARQMGTRTDPGFLAGVSIDADDPTDPVGLDAEFVFPEECPLSDGGGPDLEAAYVEGDDLDVKCMIPELVIYHSGRIRAATLVDIPAYVEARLYLDEEPPAPEASETEDETPADVLTAAAYTITIPEIAPAEWFDEPTEEPEIGAITITDEGHIFGYLAPKHVAHRGYRDRRVEVPTGNVDYGVWMNRATIVERGSAFERIATGPITMNCGHAPNTPKMRGASRQEHYDNSCSVVATARVGENGRGVWIAGALLPDVPGEQVRRMMACQLSGDWGPHRERPGKRELCGALLVPVPGFPRRSYQTVNVKAGLLTRSLTPLRFGYHMPVDPEPVGMRAAVESIAEAVGRGRETRVRTFAAELRGILRGD